MEVALKDAMQIPGAAGVALVDLASGMALGVVGGGPDLDMNLAAAADADVVRAELRTMEMLGLDEKIEDILVTMSEQYHLIRPLTGRTGQGLFLHLVLQKTHANLALARHRLKDIEAGLDV